MLDIKRIQRKLTACKEVFKGKAQISFSQYGEDLIIFSLLQRYGITSPNYLDIGANHPVLASNTFNLYLRGAKGVLVEPNPAMCRLLKAERPRDIILEAGIGLQGKASGDYYQFKEPHNALNTFSVEEAELRQESGIPLQQIVSIPLMPLNEILGSYFPDNDLHLLSIDVEGLDETIIRSVEFTLYQPLIICVEATAYDTDGKGVKRNGLNDFLINNGYTLYADTHANSIFCRTEILNAH